MILIGTKNKIKKLAKKLFDKKIFFTFQFKTQSYNLFYEINNKIKYVFNGKTLDDILELYTEDEVNKIYFVFKSLFVKYNSKGNNNLTEKVDLDINNTLFISLVDDESMVNMNHAITEIFKNRLKVNIKLSKPANVQGSIKDFELKNFICKSQEQFWKDFHMCIEKTEYEYDFRLAIYDLYIASKKNKNTHIIRNANNDDWYFLARSYK